MPKVVDLTASSPVAAPLSTGEEVMQAIEIATEDRLRSLLRMVCTQSSEARKLLEKEMIISESDLEDDDIEEDSEEGSEAEAEDDSEAEPTIETKGAAKQGNKRQLPRYAVCKRCNQEFDLTFNY